LNDFTRKYLVTGNGLHGLTQRGFEIELNAVLGEISEQLLYYKGISFYVYGENIPLAMLIRVFGVRGLESLFEQEAVEFVFNTPAVMYSVDDVKGMMPLVSSAGFTTKAHSDPEESATLGLKWLSNPLHKRVEKNIIKKAIKVYKTPSEGISKSAASFGIDGYNNNLFGKMGLPKERDISDLNRAEREKLCSFAQECVTLSILSEFNYNSLNSFHTAKLIDIQLELLKKADKIKEATNSLFELENVPNFKAMVRDKVIKYEDIPKMRKSRDAMKFRNWVDSVSCKTDSTEIVSEYLNSIESTKGILEKEPVKLLKTISICAVSGVIGGLISGSGGAIIGGVAGKALEPAVNLGISVFDGYILNGLLKGWNPRHYFTKEIKPLLKAQQGT